MKKSIRALASVSVLALSMPAGASVQSATDTTPAQPGSEAPLAPADDPAAAQSGAADIVVTGVRASLRRAQDIKRDATSVVEAITLEDLGRFSDTSVSSALQRVPGVQVDRNDDGLGPAGDVVTIRGLGGDFVNATVNGRSLLGNPGFFGGGGRNFDTASIPNEVLAGVTVFKSPTAEIIESGLGGEVNFNTLRPLDYKPGAASGMFGDNVFGSLSGTATYEDGAEKWGYRVGGVVGVKLADDTIGFYVAGARSELRADLPQLRTFNFVRDIRVQNTANGPIETLPNVLTYGGFSPSISRRTLTRDAVSAGAQWRPTPNLDVNLDILYARYETDLFNDGGDTSSAFNTAGPDEVFLPGGSEVRGGAQVFQDSRLIVGPAGQASVGSGVLRSIQDNEQITIGANVAWNSDDGRLRVAADYAHGEIDYLQDFRSIGYVQPNVPQVVDARGGGIPTTTFTVDASNPANYTSLGQFVFQSFSQGRRDAARLDLAFKATDQLTLKLGGRYQETAVNYATGFLPGQELVDNRFFRGSIQQLGFSGSVPRFDLPAFCGANPVVCNASTAGTPSFSGAFPPDGGGSPQDVFDLDAGGVYSLNETTTALYGQVDIDGQLGGWRVRGNAGVRALRIDVFGRAFQGITYRLSNEGGREDPRQPPETRPVSDKNEYWRVLPAGNLILSPRDNINLRFAVARTVSFADFSDLAPRGSVNIYTPNPDPNRPGLEQSTFDGGNTQLKPTSAWNYDATLEYYTGYGGAFVVSAFYKDVQDLIAPLREVNVSVPGQGDRLFIANRVINASGGETAGVEVQTNQPLTFLPSPFDGLGFQANYTYVWSKFESSPGVTSPFPGTSKHNANVIGYYEKGGFSARVAYSYRSDYLVSLGTFGTSVLAKGQTTLDATLSQRLHRNLEVILTAENLTGQDREEFYESGDAFASFTTRPQYYSIGLRATF